jgi:PAS domain S-box-containing protein
MMLRPPIAKLFPLLLAVAVFFFGVMTDRIFAGLTQHPLSRFADDLAVAIIVGCMAVFHERRRRYERKMAEEARFKHAAVVESSVDAIISKNLDAVITSWNVGAQRIFGYTEAEVVGQPITIIIPPELHDEENKILERLRAGGRIEHYETKRVTKTGNKVDVFLTIGPIKDSTGSVVGFSKIAHDITHRKQAEEALRELNRALEAQTAVLQSREELLKIFVKNVPAGVAMFDRDMRYLQVSDRWCVDYSVDSSQVLGRSHYELFPDLPDRWKKINRRGLAGETLRADEDRWDREGGSKWVRWEVRPWWGLDGLQGGILIFAEDITHRKQTEEALSVLRRDRENTIQRRFEEIRYLNHQIRNALVTLQLAGHDVTRDLPQKIELIHSASARIQLCLEKVLTEDDLSLHANP